MILLYHHVCPPDRVPNPDARTELEGWQYTIEPALLEAQLCALRRRGYEFVSLGEYVDRLCGPYLDADGRSRSRLATVTFDDGWRDNSLWAVPVLEKLGIPATFFIVTGDIPGVAADRRMTPEQVRALRTAGMTVGAHSRSHRNLTTVDSRGLDDEVLGSKADIERILNEPVEWFAYPGGRFDRRAAEAVKRHGFLGACSVIGGGRNTGRSRFWLFREVFSPRLDSCRDRLRLSRVGGLLLRCRAELAVRRILGAP